METETADDMVRKTRVEEGLHELRMALTPYVEGRMKRHYGEEWQRHFPPRQGAAQGGLQEVQALLKAILDNWTDVFRDELQQVRTYVQLCSEARQAVAHCKEDLEGRESLRYLDSAWMLTTALGTDFQARRLQDLYEEQLAEAASPGDDGDGAEDAAEDVPDGLPAEAVAPSGPMFPGPEPAGQFVERPGWHPPDPFPEHPADYGRPQHRQPRRQPGGAVPGPRHGPQGGGPHRPDGGQPRRHPNRFRVGERRPGKVVGIIQHGYMLDLGAQRPFLLHRKNLPAGNGNGQGGPGIGYALGDILSVEVLSTDSLGRPNLAPAGAGAPVPTPRSGGPAGNASQMPRVGQVVQGTVRGIYPRGASIELDREWSGFLHISNVSRDYVANMADHVRVGDALRLVVLEVNRGRKKLGLGLKQVA